MDNPRLAAPLWNLLEEEIAVRRIALLEMLRSAEYQMLERQLVDALQAPPLSAKADAPPVSVLPDLVDQCWRRLKSCHSSFDNRPDDTQLHALRIEAKRVRYAAEASAETCGKPAEKLGSRAADLQDVLGDLHDSIIAAHWLKKVERNPGTAEAANDLYAMQVAAARKHRRAWARAWEALDRKQLRPRNW